MSNKNRVLVSYHYAIDEAYKESLGRRFDCVVEAIVRRSVNDGDIDPTWSVGVDRDLERSIVLWIDVIANSPENTNTVQDWINQACLCKSTKEPRNSQASFGKNRTDTEWTN